MQSGQGRVELALGLLHQIGFLLLRTRLLQDDLMMQWTESQSPERGIYRFSSSLCIGCLLQPGLLFSAVDAKPLIRLV